MRKLKLLSIGLLCLLIILTFIIYNRKERYESIPFYKNAHNLEKIKRGNQLGVSYCVKLEYPKDIDSVFKFYDSYLLKNGWERDNSKDVKWMSFIDVQGIKINYLVCEWVNHKINKEFMLFLRYEIEPSKENSTKQIEQQVSFVIVPWYFRLN
jgi:hypothetical protein